MRNYQPRKNNDLWIRGPRYMMTINLIRDYDGLVEEMDSIIDESPEPGQPRGSDISKPSESKALRMVEIRNQIRAIEAAREKIPQEYIRGIEDNIKYGIRYPRYAARSTYSYWKRRYIWNVAKNMHWVG